MKLIPKYQNPWGTLNYRGPQYSEVLSQIKSENPLAYKRLLTERAKSKQPHSEVVIDDEGNTVTNVGAGYMSGTDPLGEMYVSGVALDPAFKWLGKQALWGLGKTGNNWARAKLISREMTPSKTAAPKFKSELDWSPKSWFGNAAKRESWTPEDEQILASHVPEYLEIERAAKANGTWLKMKDGSIWQGDPREWVMRHSKNAEPWETESVWYTGVPKNIKADDEYIGDVWASSKDVAKEYAHRLDNPLLYYNFHDPKFIKSSKEFINTLYQKLIGKGYVKSISYPKNSKQLTIEANDSHWTSIPNTSLNKLVPKNWKMPYVNDATDQDWLYYELTKHKNFSQPTDGIIRLSKQHNFDTTNINNVKDAVYNVDKSINELIIHENTPRKSFLGNNGNLSLKDKNIYRIGIPFLFGTSYLNKKGEP